MYTWGDTGYYAAYHPVQQSLILNETFLKSSNGMKAVILAHEFRHSRQLIFKHIMTIATAFFVKADHEHFLIVEHEAERFQEEVRSAIYLR